VLEARLAKERLTQTLDLKERIDDYADRTRQIGARKPSFFSRRTFVVSILAVGVLLRLVQYLSNPSLWQDEAFLALNIINKSAADLWEPLNNRQSAPIGFLLGEKSVVDLAGTSEYALRFIPFACGIAALVLFFVVARSWVDNEVGAVALTLFAVTLPLIDYGAQVKQYSVDVAAALALYLGVILVRRAPLSLARGAAFGLFAAIVVWFSHPSIFVLAAIGIAVGITVLEQRQREAVAAVAIALMLVAVSFGASYAVSRNQVAGVQEALDIPQSPSSSPIGNIEPTGDGDASGVYMPLPPSATTVKWGGEKLTEIVNDTLGSHRALTGVVAIVLLVGALSFFRRARETALILTLPIPLVVIASALELYPLGARYLLFLVPALTLLLAEGAVTAVRQTRVRAPIIGLVLAASVVIAPVVAAASNFVDPKTRNEIKPLLERLGDQARPGDGLYVVYPAQYPVRYYWERGALDGPGRQPPPWPLVQASGGRDQYAPALESRPPRLIIGEYDDPFEQYVEELEPLRGNPRVWAIVVHFGAPPFHEAQSVVSHLDDIGTQRAAFHDTGVSLFLYDLS
jgi:Dolichyl-phosphate-mannose-protein mannosyltransferase